jgi:hypothetical protein
MKDPTSKLTGATEFESELLDAARHERIPHELKLRMGAALRTPLATGAALGSTSSRWLQSKPATWLLVSGLALGTTAGWQHLKGPKRAQTLASAPRHQVQPAAAASAALPTSEPNALPLPAADGVRPAAPVPSASSTHAHASSLRDEIALLDRARDALQEKAANQALGLLAQYTRRFAHGSLVPEAAALHIDALAMQGDAARANEEARRFLHTYPQHPLSQRMERWIAPSPARVGLDPAR